MFKDFQSEIKLFLLVAFIAVVISVGGVFLLQNAVRNQVSHTPLPAPSPQPQATEGWQTYNNEEFGFEVRFPEEFKVSLRDAYLVSILTDRHVVEGERCNAAQSKLREKDVPFGPVPCLFGLFISLKAEDVRSKLYDERTKEIYGSLDILGAVELHRDYQAPGIAVAVPVELGGSSFILFEGYPTGEEYPKELKIFEEILSTFRFVDEG